MKNISVTIDDKLYRATKAEAARRRKTVSALVRDLLSNLNAASNEKHIALLDKKHAQGYAKHPVAPGEFDVPASELVWGEP